ncbi:hypothetical protein TYRP_006870 [Tyrophagus putrescentiae]|nr:hypothetical protein TYRP_006870 [Tyrophagus putrescentiae]
MKFAVLLACIASISAAVLADTKHRNSTDTRIINGVEIPISQARYQVSIQTKSGAHVCGGTIIADRWVLTTAKCAQGITPATHQIRYNTNIHNFGGDIARVSSVYLHSSYNPGQLQNNIALISTVEEFPSIIYSNVRLRCGGYEVNNELLRVAGWGSTIDNSGLLSAKLRQVTLPYAGQSCRDYYSTVGITVDYNMFCAGSLETGGSGICVGDEGGAAVKDYYGYNVVPELPPTSTSAASRGESVCSLVLAPTAAGLKASSEGSFSCYS